MQIPAAAQKEVLRKFPGYDKIYGPYQRSDKTGKFYVLINMSAPVGSGRYKKLSLNYEKMMLLLREVLAHI